MASTIVLCFIAGVLAANATPHFIKGITKEQSPAPFSPAPLPNLIGGWAMYVLAALLLLWGHVGQHPLAALIAGCRSRRSLLRAQYRQEQLVLNPC